MPLMGAALIFATVMPWQVVNACSRILYETGHNSYIVGRSMDWADPKAQTDLWVFPRGMARDGGVGKDPIKWTSKYGSVITSFYNVSTADGMNEKGLVGNMLYLVESNYGNASTSNLPTLSVGAWLQYFLDHFATVDEAVAAMKNPPFIIIAPTLPNGLAASVHLSLADASGDSVIFEYIGGKLTIHHNPDYKVMTNSPVYDQQLALNDYWNLIGGDNFLPGTIRAADRFVRLSYNLKSSPKFKDNQLAVASVFSQIRNISVPLGMKDPQKPNISMTLWRTIADIGERVYYFDSAVMPSVFWVDLSKVDFKEGSGSKMIKIRFDHDLAGEVSDKFTKAPPFAWLKPQTKD